MHNYTCNFKLTKVFLFQPSQKKYATPAFNYFLLGSFLLISKPHQHTIPVIKLRSAELPDYIEIAKLHADNWRLTYRGIMSDNYLNNQVDNERLETWYKRLKNTNGSQFVTVSTLENSIVGFCCLIINEDSIFGSYIESLHVAAHLQKSGIGKIMICHSAKIISEKASSKKMYLWVYESNTNARMAYESLGATNYETIQKANGDGNISKSCRYIWDNVTSLI